MSGIISRLCAEISLPQMIKVNQLFEKDGIPAENIPKAVEAELQKSGLDKQVKPGMRIAITCGSRGVANIAIITRSIADYIKKLEGKPLIVPAMGSHGGATAEGQKELLARYGVTEEFTECPILSSMETVEIGKTVEAVPAGKTVGVRIDKNAAEADGIIVAGRIKPHTDFRGPFESGIMKMMAIGLGKREGADICHEAGFEHMGKMVPLFGRTILKYAPVILGFGITENAWGETCRLTALQPEEIEKKEPLLLEEARKKLPLIPFTNIDVLVVDRIGKDISGNGMDPNITGATPCSPNIKSSFSAQRTVILDLTPQTHGSAFGMGAAHVITKRLFNKIDFDATYVNALTSRGIDFVRIPAVAENDREAVQLAIKTCINPNKNDLRIIRIKDSLSTHTLLVSPALEEEVKANPRLEITETGKNWDFDAEGNILE